MKGIVLRSTGKFYTIKGENGSTFEAQIKGKVRLIELDVTNPIAVGDVVELEKSGGVWMITKIEERNNFIVRISPKKKHLNQIIASNIDQAILVVTLNKPRTSSGFIDRFIVTAESYHIPTIIVFNKQDALREKDVDKQAELIAVYNKIGYKTLLTSAINNEGVDELKALMKDKTSLLSGHSGVGKSTLTNAVDSTLNLRDRIFETRMDSRGEVVVQPSFIFAAGKTFKSGKLNIPVNGYFIPSKDGFRVGLSFGFNSRSRFENH